MGRDSKSNEKKTKFKSLEYKAKFDFGFYFQDLFPILFELFLLFDDRKESTDLCIANYKSNYYHYIYYIELQLPSN